MTKQQAYELAEKESKHTGCSYYETAARAMEIYAAAFAEWLRQNCYFATSPKLWWMIDPTKEIRLTTAELLIEFEKS